MSQKVLSPGLEPCSWDGWACDGTPDVSSLYFLCFLQTPIPTSSPQTDTSTASLVPIFPKQVNAPSPLSCKASVKKDHQTDQVYLNIDSVRI